MNQKLDARALGFSVAVLYGLFMLALGIAGIFGAGWGIIKMMQPYHPFFSASATGIIVGVCEGLAYGMVFGYLFGYLYNKFARQ